MSTEQATLGRCVTDYNESVPLDVSKPKPKPNIRQVETIGLILLVIIVLTITIVRYWGHIPWSAR